MDNYLQHIASLKSKIKKIELDIIDYIQENRIELKKFMPTKGKTYLINNISDAFKYSCLNSDYNFEYGESYYFKVTNNQLYVNNLASYGKIYVTGYILNSNMIRIKEFREEAIDIQKLSEYTELDSDYKQTYVYIMFDRNTGYYKLGRSKNPKVREKTLQSEKPTIEMLHCFSAINLDEKNLHLIFKEKRVRGEWFDLSGSDIQNIITYFNSKTTTLTPPSQSHQAHSNQVQPHV